MNKKDILDAYNFRYACKEFNLDKKISDEDFNFILETARVSPSAIGLEPWGFIVIQNEDLREKLLPYCSGAQSQLKTASHFVIILARTVNALRYDSEYINHILADIKHFPNDVIDGFKNFLKAFQNSSFDNLKDEKAIFSWSSKQTYIPLANMMTAAAQIKIDSCAIEGFNKEKVEEILSEEGILDKDNFGVSCMVAFGYRKNEDKDKAIKLRQPLNEITKWV